VTEQLAGALERSGIPAIALKGPIMARELYGDSGLRVTSDIDLLVGRADFKRAVEILSDHGYVAESIVDWTDGLPLFEATLRSTEPWSPNVDLHWRLHWSHHGFSADALARSLPPGVGPPRARPTPPARSAVHDLRARSSAEPRGGAPRRAPSGWPTGADPCGRHS
jgi:hypothetical protein